MDDFRCLKPWPINQVRKRPQAFVLVSALSALNAFTQRAPPAQKSAAWCISPTVPESIRTTMS
nr:MAG TPA: hypothetical protein [Caudoviricetes sp.]